MTQDWLKCRSKSVWNVHWWCLTSPDFLSTSVTTNKSHLSNLRQQTKHIKVQWRLPKRLDALHNYENYNHFLCITASTSTVESCTNATSIRPTILCFHFLLRVSCLFTAPAAGIWSTAINASICLSVRSHILETTPANFTKFSARPWLSPPLTTIQWFQFCGLRHVCPYWVCTMQA